jgi:hypothetical protein
MMRKCCGASVRVLIGGGNIIVEDAEVLQLAPDRSDMEKEMIDYREELEEDFNAIEWAAKNLVRPPEAYKTAMKVTLATCDTIGMIDRRGREALNAQRGESEYAVAALMIWMKTEDAIWLLERIPIHRIPLKKWDCVKSFFAEARRIGRITKNDMRQEERVARLRRLHTLRGRTIEQADWEKEFAERTESAKRKYAAGACGIISEENFRRVRKYSLREIAIKTIDEIKHKCGDFKEFFESRWWHMPGGTTSQSKRVKNAYAGEEFFDNMMVASKKTVWETISYEEMLLMMKHKCQVLARGSTKPEPGLKKRALLAIDDISHIISSYASQYMERNVQISGVVVSQMPVDVARWVSLDCGERGVLVSNDYDNYNIQHSLESLMEINFEMAERWLEVFKEGDDDWALEKALAAVWTALSYRNAYMRVGDKEVKVKRGLFSGHRDTARDNTFLHLAYYRSIMSVIGALFDSETSEGNYYMSGDDEISRMKMPWEAMVYTVVGNECGLVAQIDKGLVSWRHSEFLQLWSIPGNIPIYPVAHTILTFCSGNWYKDNIRDLTGTIANCRDQCFEMFRCGLPILFARALAYKTLNFLMKIKKENGDLMELEWYKYRNAGTKEGHPLWLMGVKRTDDVCEPPKVSIKRPRFIGMKTLATDDGMRRERKFWRKVPAAMAKRVKLDRAWKNHNSITMKWQQGEIDKWAEENWEVRKRRELSRAEFRKKPIFKDSCGFRYRNTLVHRAPEEKFAVCASIGFPAELLGTKYESLVFSELHPREASRLILCKETEPKEIEGDMWMLPTTLRRVAATQ